MSKGKLYVIEGSDSSGKKTQSDLLYKKLKKEGKRVRLISFPNYESDSSALVKMYLAGDFGDNPEDVNIYAASTFYAVDRYASYKKDWKEFYESGGIIITDRYTTSNMVHQAAKLDNPIEKDEYISWLLNLEYELYKIPTPDKVFFLDVIPTISENLMKDRLNKITNEEGKDIHEANSEFLRKCYNSALDIAKLHDWNMIKCDNGEDILDIEEIHEKIYRELKSELI